MDPVEFRIKNDTLTDESKNKPFSSRHLKECFQVGAEKFGWSRRTPGVGSMKKGDVVLGWGVAAASWGAGRASCSANVILKDDGTARASCATQDIGTGTYTVFAQVVSDKTGIPVDKIEVVLGDSSLSPGPTSGGSTATATVVPAIADAVENATRSLFALASKTAGSPYLHQDPARLRLTNGRVHSQDQGPEQGIAFKDLLVMARVGYVNGDGRTGGLGSDTKAHDYSTHSFGAQFVEVEWDPGIARLRVSRVVTVIDGGRIINAKTATNQIAGAVVMGVGMGLLEHAYYDPRYGHPMNDNYADYLVPTNADAPQIDVTFLDYPDPMMGAYGARGIGEIGLAGVAPAITAAVYHATGVRVRELPVRIEDLLTSKVTI
jgi:xanthine dehydrogenase YagR molybdenum-binding subunit